MLPYFYKLSKRLISDNLSDKLTDFSLSNVDKFTEHITDSGNPDGNHYLSSDRLQSINEIQQLKEKCSLDFYAILYLHKPGVNVIKHVDNPKYRKSNLIHPLFPKTDYSSTQFWEDEKLVTVCNFDDRLPVILNLNKFHSVNNNNNYRINLQFSFKEDFDTLVNLYKDQKIFNL